MSVLEKFRGKKDGNDGSVGDPFTNAVRANSRNTVLADVDTLLSRYLSAGALLPVMVPTNTHNAAAWFLDYLFEPYDRVPDRVIQTHGGGYIALYAQRINDLMRRFLALDETHQRYVIAVREDGVYWRGDDMAYFPMIVEETVKYKAMGDDEKAGYRRVGEAHRRAVVEGSRRWCEAEAGAMAGDTGAVAGSGGSDLGPAETLWQGVESARDQEMAR